MAVLILAVGLCALSGSAVADVGPGCESPAFALGESTILPLETGGDPALERIGRAMVDADACLPTNAADAPNVKVLPGVPAAVVMTLVGFLCVSLGRDRRAWLAVAGGLIWLGQAGTMAVPQLMRRACSRSADAVVQRGAVLRGYAAVQLPCGPHGALRYVALLRKLDGIPRHDRSCFTLRASANHAGGAHSADRSNNTHPAAAQDALILSLTVCPAKTAGVVVCFSPAFIFSNLSRGPPVYS